MPLLDHFHPPLSVERHWPSLHTLWTGALTRYLNGGRLPAGYFAEAQVYVGGRVEIDVASWEANSAGASASGNGGTATLTAPVYAPPAPPMTWQATFPDQLEVLVYGSEGGPTLAAAIELVSPGNKDRPEARQAFVAKCATLLHEGVGLVVIDIVTSRQDNLHDELARLMNQWPASAFPAGTHLYAAAYRPARRDARDQIDVWPEALAVGQNLPTLPLALPRVGCVPLDLEATYTEAREWSGL